MSLAPDKKMKLPAAKVIPAYADETRPLERDCAVNRRSQRFPLWHTGLVLRLLYEETGQDLVEYAFIMALVGLGAIAAISGLAGKLKNALNIIGSNLLSAT